MGGQQGWKTIMASCAAAVALAACGGDANNDPSPQPAPAPAPAPAPTPGPGEPTLSNNVAVDGRNWINHRREQAGVPAVASNSRLDAAAQGHSDWQRRNNRVSHDQVPGTPGFTGASVRDRLTAAGYTFSGSFAYGEVIAATSNRNGFEMVDELITAIFHRFVILEPVFKEVGTGAATSSANYSYFTANFAANNGYGPGVTSIVTWPFGGQTGVTRNFFSDTEAPDPIANANEVGYPISVHANITSVLTVQTFTVRPRGGAVLPVALLSKETDARPETPTSAAAIIPLQPLAANTTYDVSFTGNVSGAAVSRNWSFTTR
jgi:uncharacterized protein YkwD